MSSTRKLGKVEISRPKIKSSDFPVSHSVQTTFELGALHPIHCNFMVPNASIRLQPSELVRCAPFAGPTVGRIKCKTFTHFVGISELWKNWESFLTQRPVAFSNGSTITPYRIPTVSLKYLSALALWGAKCSLWVQCSGSMYGINQDAATRSQTKNSQWFLGVFRPQWENATTRTAEVFENTMVSCLESWFQKSVRPLNTDPSTPNMPCFDFKWAYDKNASTTDHFYIPSGNKTYGSFFKNQAYINSTSPVLDTANNNGYDLSSTIHPDGADLIYETVGTTSAKGMGSDYNNLTSETVAQMKSLHSVASPLLNYMACFRLSNFGKRIKNILEGLGYELDLSSDERVSIFPLMATYKCYWHSFGLSRYNNWETSNCMKLKSCLDNNDIQSIIPYGMDSDSNNMGQKTADLCFMNMMLDLGNMWFTDAQDFVGAHTEDLNVSQGSFDTSTVNGEKTRFTSGTTPSSTAMLRTGDTPDGTLSETGGVKISHDIDFNTMDLELLKTMYHLQNAETQIGKKIAEALRLRCGSDYVNNLKSNFLGSTETNLDIDDIASNTDTYNEATGEGAMQGQVTGISNTFKQNKSISFKCHEYGYVITLAGVCVDSDYCQMMDGTLFARRPQEFYNSILDGKGFQLTRKDQIVGYRPIVHEYRDASTTAGAHAAFGYIPVYSEFKIGRSVCSGDFSRRGSRKNLRPYFLEKIIDLNERKFSDISNVSSSSGSTMLANWSNKTGDGANDSVKIDVVSSNQLLSPAGLPTAGDCWRFNCRYRWLNNYLRIFRNHGKDEPWGLFAALENGDANNPVFEWTYRSSSDPITYQAMFRGIMKAPMLPLEKTFGTTDAAPEGGNGGAVKA